MSRVGKRVGFVAAGLVVVIAVVAIVGLAVDDAHQRRQVDQLHAHHAELARAAAATTSELTAVRQQLDQNKKDLDAATAANKVPGVRAALCTDAETARGARRWNDANVLALSLRLTSPEVAKEMLDAFLATPADEPAPPELE